MNISGRYWIVLISVVGVACGGYNYSYSPISSIEMETELLSGVGLLNCEIHYDSALGHSVINLKTLKETKGLFDLHTLTTSDTHLILTQVDEVGNVLFVYRFDHPLFRSVEYLDEGGRFKRVMVKQKKSSILIRVPMYSKTVEFTLVEVIQGKEVFKYPLKR